MSTTISTELLINTLYENDNYVNSKFPNDPEKNQRIMEFFDKIFFQTFSRKNSLKVSHVVDSEKKKKKKKSFEICRMRNEECISE